MFERSLFERLAHPPTDEDRRLELDASVLAESVMRYLREIFNSRQGSAETRPDFGMPDFNDLALQFPDAIPVIGQAIQYQIENFEPRLKGCTVRHIPDPANPLSVCFQISAQLPVGNRRISFDTIVGDDGYYRLRT